jgi:CheY-like chemotaxis protein
MDRQVNQLARLVEDLLDISRITRGKIELKLQDVDLVRCLRHVVEDQRGAVESDGLQLEVHLPGQPVWIRADPARMVQIAGNLLQNALRFTRAPGVIEVRLAGAGDFAELRVRDTGMGIAPDVMGSIFEPFIQGPQGLAREGGGLGLGLSLVKGLTELHGGTVSAHSDGIGKGAAFVVRFPLCTPRTVPQRAVQEVAPASRKSVLVVDDNHDAAESFAALLKSWGHDVSIAHGGAEALRLVRERRPEVVFCDIGLPGMDGYQVAKALRKDADLAGMRLVAVSGYVFPEDHGKSMQAGFDQHIAKPFDPEVVRQIIG